MKFQDRKKGQKTLILWRFTEKLDFRELRKNQIQRGELPKKMGARGGGGGGFRQFADLRGAQQKKEKADWCF